MDQGQLPEDPLSDLEYDAQHCYRHPDRETGVSCGQCGRPICYECMIPAPVGFRCPECVAEQRRGSGRARVVTRSQMRGRWQGGLAGSGGMTATKVLVGINVVVFLLQFLGPALGLTERWSLVPALVAIDHQYYRLFTSLFLHANFFHILFNMWALLVLGDYLEGVVGKAKFLVVYFLAGFGSSVLVMVMGRPLQPVVGASGAIFGLFAGLLVYAWVNRRRDFTASLLLRQFAFLLVINLAINVLSAVGGGRLSWQGHAGGFLTGLAVMAALTAFGRRDPRDSVDGVSLGLLLALGAVLLAVLLLRVQTFPTLL